MLLLANIALSLAMLGAFALAVGGLRLWLKHGNRRGALMLIAAFVILANVLIWTLPAPGG